MIAWKYERVKQFMRCKPYGDLGGLKLDRGPQTPVTYNMVGISMVTKGFPKVGHANILEDHEASH